LLAVTPELPKPDQQGGDGRLWWLLRLLARRHRVTIYPCSDTEEPRDVARYGAALRREGVHVLRGSWGSGLEDALARYVFDAVLFEFWSSAELGTERVRRQQPWARVIVDSVDANFRREEAEAALGLGDPATVLDHKRRELAACRNADAVVFVSDEDGMLLEAAAGSLRRFTLANVVDERPRSVRPRDPELLFLGGFRLPPNRDGILWFVNTIWPAIRAAVPTARLSVVGSQLPDDLREEIQLPGVAVVGYVPDVASSLDRAALMIAPLRYGAGMKNKVTEAMGAGLAVVTTSVGAQGLEVVSGTHLEIADEPDTFARRVIALLGDPERAERMGRAGRDYIAGVCFPTAIEPRLEALLDTVVDGRRITVPPPEWWVNRVCHSARRARFALGRARRNLLGQTVSPFSVPRRDPAAQPAFAED
jgi:glycosyltransferase involved in cell wall biosynthesis